MGTPRAFDDYPLVMNTAQVAEMLNLPSIKNIAGPGPEGTYPRTSAPWCPPVLVRAGRDRRMVAVGRNPKLNPIARRRRVGLRRRRS
jgi:hypothetical protein